MQWNINDYYNKMCICQHYNAVTKIELLLHIADIMCTQNILQIYLDTGESTHLNRRAIIFLRCLLVCDHVTMPINNNWEEHDGDTVLLLDIFLIAIKFWSGKFISVGSQMFTLDKDEKYPIPQHSIFLVFDATKGCPNLVIDVGHGIPAYDVYDWCWPLPPKWKFYREM